MGVRVCKYPELQHWHSEALLVSSCLSSLSPFSLIITSVYFYITCFYDCYLMLPHIQSNCYMKAHPHWSLNLANKIFLKSIFSANTGSSRCYCAATNAYTAHAFLSPKKLKNEQECVNIHSHMLFKIHLIILLLTWRFHFPFMFTV